MKITYGQWFRIAIVAAAGWELGKVIPDTVAYIAGGVFGKSARTTYKTAWHRGDEYTRRSQRDFNKPTVVPDPDKKYQSRPGRTYANDIETPTDGA